LLDVREMEAEVWLKYVTWFVLRLDTMNQGSCEHSIDI
jgi:hypothetical protein